MTVAWTRQETEALVERGVAALDLSLWGCQWEGNDAQCTLNVYIDKPGGVSIEDCAKAIRQIQALFHVHLPEKLPFHWEVKSPGAERILLSPAHYQERVGSHVTCWVKKTSGRGNKRLKGVLTQVSDEGLTLEDASGLTSLHSWQDVQYARATLEEKKHD